MDPEEPPPMQYGGGAGTNAYRPPGNFHTVSVGLLAALPACTFLIVSLVTTFCFHNLPLLVYCVCGFFVGMSLVSMAVPPKRQGLPSYWFLVGCLCLMATLIGVGLTFVRYEDEIGVYWEYDGARDYTNVRPDEPALSHLDAGRIEFSKDAHLDTSRSRGYREGGQIYCVAPVVGPSVSGQVQYFASGTNCCEEKGKFECEDASNKEAHSGLVVLNEREVAKYRKAAEGAQASPDALFLYWTENASEAQEAYFDRALRTLCLAVLMYTIASIVVAIAVHCAPRGRGIKVP